jgi:hypothetical protein
MKTIFTLVQRRDNGKWIVAVGPTAPRAAHRRFVKHYRVAKKSPNYAAVCMCLPLRTIKLDDDPAARETATASAPAAKPAQPAPKPAAGAKPKPKATAKPKNALTTFASRLAGKA